MENCDNGIVIYENNEVPEEYSSNLKIRDLRGLRTAENTRKLTSVLNNPDYVDIQPDGKVLWKGRKNKDGYALINIKILPDIPEDFEGSKEVLGHRLVQELINGGAPTNALVCHRSDTPSDLNPNNLFLGTFAQNSSVVPIHGRRIYPKGQEHWNAKLDENKVVQIIHLHYANVMTIRRIAKKFHVCPQTISNVVNCRGPWVAIAKVATSAALAARM